MDFDSDWGRSGEDVLFLNVVLKQEDRERGERGREEPKSTGGTLIFSLKEKRRTCALASGSWKGWEWQRDGLL